MSNLDDDYYGLVFPYHGFEHFKLIVYKVPYDNNCFFHAIMLGSIKQYRLNKEDRYNLIMKFRKTLSDHLDNLYYKLSRGNLEEFSKSVPEYKINNLKQLIEGKNCVGLEAIELTSIVLDINIAILDIDTYDVYMTGDDELINNRDTGYVVLLYDRKRVHYELVGLEKGEIITYFCKNHSFIRHINNRIRILSHRKSS